MKLHLTNADGQHLITAYDEKSIAINHQKYTKSLVVTPNALIENWLNTNVHSNGFKSITQEHIAAICALKPEVVLLGTGQTHQFLHPKHFAPLAEIGIALECMTTAAACRTYNILMSEGRHVAAALLLE